jgi:hypothetical protein
MIVYLFQEFLGVSLHILFFMDLPERLKGQKIFPVGAVQKVG